MSCIPCGVRSLLAITAVAGACAIWGSPAMAAADDEASDRPAAVEPAAAEQPASDQPAAGDGIPSPQELADLLRREPISLANWPAWRKRLLAWIGDRSRATDSAYETARRFVREQAEAHDHALPDALATDSLAWYLLGSAYLYGGGEDRAEAQTECERGEAALRKSIDLDPDFARAHRNLAIILSRQDALDRPNPARGLAANLRPARERSAQIEAELATAARLDPALPLKHAHAEVAFEHEQYATAARLFREALVEEPENASFAQGGAWAVLNIPGHAPRAAEVQGFADRFPQDGTLAALHGLALAMDGNPREGVREFERARALGVEPAKVFDPKVVQAVEREGAPSWVEGVAWVALYFVGFYAIVMAVMAGVGLVLDQATRGDRALTVLATEAQMMVTAGQVVRSSGETALAKLYAAALILGLVLFYLAVPFVVAGVLVLTGGLLWLIFMTGHIPIKLVILLPVIAAGMVWSIVKSLFASTGGQTFGIAKAKEQCPRLFEALAEVAERVDTPPVDEVYLAPGSEIGVHQRGRGPFGVLGSGERVLTLGMSTMRFLSVGELKAILAHEYAHFSHHDTRYGRFIHQVTISIADALRGMGAAGGRLNYVNPSYWFLHLYYRAYAILAAGFSRSREFLADRMAAGLYGSDVFVNSLTKVATDGSLFESTMYQNISQLLGQDKAFVNMYEAFQKYVDEQVTREQHDEMARKLLDEKSSIFASHPTFRERVAAVTRLPMASHEDMRPAIELFDNAPEVEQELTDFLTGYMHHMRRLQAAG